MIRSMTGFGRQETADDQHRIVVEMKSVNHRYLDLNLKMPKKFNLFEARIRQLVKDYAERGKVDLFITCDDFGEASFELRYNQELAAAYVQDIRRMSEEFSLPMDLSASRLAAFPDVLVMEHQEEDEETLWPLLEQALRGAGEAFLSQRQREGASLASDILDKLSGMEESVSFIESRSPETVQEYRERLEGKMRELLDTVPVEEARLMTEVAIFADKTCVDEEMVRLRTHIHGMREALSGQSRESVGRRLDFLAQEMNREANTTLSKCSNMEISAAAISLKTEIEKIREQVQNIE